MLTLTIMRHAKSSWLDMSLDDFHRPLNKRGRGAAAAMGKWFCRHNRMPDLLLVSRAARTLETWKIMKKAGVKADEVRKLQRLYLASSSEILELIRGVEGDVSHLMLLGHNPGLHLLVKSLISTEEPVGDGAFYGKFPTAAVAQMTFDMDDWSDIAPMGGKYYRYVTPKQLTAQETSLDDYLDR